MPDSNRPLAAKPVPVKSKQVEAWYVGGTDGVAGRFPSGRTYECNKGDSVTIEEEDYNSLAPSEWTLTEPIVTTIPAVTNGDSKENK